MEFWELSDFFDTVELILEGENEKEPFLDFLLLGNVIISFSFFS
jgi:hypothetical protein